MILCRMRDYNQIIDNNIATYYANVHEYPALQRAAIPLGRPSAPILGRDMSELREALRNPEKANVALLGEAGTGKTAIMQGLAYHPDSTQYLVLSVNTERLIVDNNADKDIEMANGLQDLVDEASQYTRGFNIILILFIDEFHRIAMVSKSSVEALKPILEKSAYNGFRVVGATTFEEYEEWIAPNRALDQRLLRFTIPELTREAVMQILESRARLYNVHDLAEENIYNDIYDTSKQLLISNAQPRASIDILNNMIGNIVKNEYMEDGQLIREYSTCEDLNIPGDKVLSRPILNKVIRRTYGVDIDNRVSAKELEEALRTRIFDQEFAISTVMNRFKMMMAGFNDPTRPKVSILMTGPTGTGKTELVKVVAETLKVPLKRFDMSRYPRAEDSVRFADELAHAGWSAPNGVILIDEIEKSSRQAINTLLQVLDDARLTSATNSNNVISFAGTIIFITTNVGSDIYQHLQKHARKDADGKIDGQTVDVSLIYNALREDDRFEQAVLGRIDVIVPFMGLSPYTLKRIAKRELDTNIAIMETQHRRVLTSPDILPYVVEDHTSNDVESGGARDVKRNMKNIIIQHVANYLAEEPDEVPLIVYIGGKPRFATDGVLDPWSGKVEHKECHPIEKVESWLSQVAQQTGITVRNHGIFVPNDWTGNKFASQVADALKAGSRDLKTFVVGETIWVDDIKRGEIVSEQIAQARKYGQG